MAFIAEVAPDELDLQAIHRLVTGLPAGFDPADALRRHFELVPAPGEAAALTAAMASQGAPALVTAEGTWLLGQRDRPASGGSGPDPRRVDEALGGLPHHATAYQHGAARAVDAVRQGRAEAAVLVRPVTVDQLAEAVRQGERMPPKSTYFHPKPRTGFVFRSIR
jgi:hypothetical protein